MNLKRKLLLIILGLCLLSPVFAQDKVVTTNFDCRPQECDCFDGIDNDNDGRTDCEDLDCFQFYHGSQRKLYKSKKRFTECEDLACAFDAVDMQNQAVEKLIYDLEHGAADNILAKLIKVAKFFDKCNTSNWESYKGKGIVPKCIWESGTPRFAYTMGIVDGGYGEVKELYEFIKDYEKNSYLFAGILMQSSVALFPADWEIDCENPEAICQLEELVDKMKEQIACLLACDEAKEVEHELFTKENILKGCKLRKDFPEALDNLISFIDNEEAITELAEQIGAKITIILDKLENGNIETSYKAGKIAGIISLNFIPITAVTKAERTKSILAYLQSLTTQQLDDLGRFIDDVFDRFVDFYDGLSDSKKVVYGDATKILPINAWKKIVNNPKLIDAWDDLRKLRACPRFNPCEWEELLKDAYLDLLPNEIQDLAQKLKNNYDLDEFTRFFNIEKGKRRLEIYIKSLVYRRIYSGTVFRGDRASLTPEVVFNSGFLPRGNHDNLIKHLDGGNVNQGNFVSTSKRIDIADEFASNNGYVYKIQSRDGIDVNQTLGEDADRWFPEQEEVSIPRGILPEDIIGAYPKGKLSDDDFIKNPNFNG